MNTYFIIKIIHIISAAILMGTGLGIAFFMYRSKFTDDLHQKYYAASNTVLADFLLTTPAVIIQPLTGFWLIWTMGYPWNAPWLLTSYVLYGLIGCFWLLVVYIQIRLKQILKTCIEENKPLPEIYYQLFQIWFWMGIPAFTLLTGIFYLMVVKKI